MKKLVPVFLLVVLFLLIYREFTLLFRPVSNNDEGIYLTTFFLIDKGYKLYDEIFFSQLPGFFLGSYPFYILLGKTIQAVRFSILFWSLVSFIALFRLGKMIKNRMVGFLSVLILLTIPTYYFQITSFQADGLAVAFSAIALLFLLKYSKKADNVWLIPFGLFFSLAFLTKADISLIAPTLFVFLMLIKRKTTSLKAAFNNLLFLGLTIGLFLLIFLLPFGIFRGFEQVFLLRKLAYNVYSSDFRLVFKYLFEDRMLTIFFISSLLIYFFKRPKLYSYETVFFVWLVFSFLTLFLYRPIFEHHLVFIVIPSALTFTSVLNWISSSPAKGGVFAKTLLNLVIATIIGFNFIRSLSMYQYINTPISLTNFTVEQKEAIEIVERLSAKEDFIVSDEALIPAVTNRMIPPELVDMSLVRFKTGSISPEVFEKTIRKHNPKLVLAWNGRLNRLKGLEEILGEYEKINYSGGKKVFFRIN